MTSRAAASIPLENAARRAGVQDSRVLDAFRKIDRRQFVPSAYVDRADTDRPIPIAHGQVTTQPSLVARMLEALELSGGERVLEIGTGLGYQTAVLATLAREVYSIERFADLAAQACANLERAGIRNATVVTGDGTRGLLEHAPYDAIVIAAAAPTVPPALVEQLADGGRLVQPIGRGGDELVTKFRKRDGRLVDEGMLTPAFFVPLVSGTQLQ
ncbi:MAG: protein-L-isoaspartate(D-aspartate) O-methyltransferase [Gemmatimonadota bacterium]|nr:protein-L-isoaspartate(D-aspartate) O-methyltransferase [Gemmatimonadota bacterium]